MPSKIKLLENTKMQYYKYYLVKIVKCQKNKKVFNTHFFIYIFDAIPIFIYKSTMNNTNNVYNM